MAVLTTSTPKQRLSFTSAKKNLITAKLTDATRTRDVSSSKRTPTSLQKDVLLGSTRSYEQTPSGVRDGRSRKEVKALQEENNELKAELSYIKSLYQQLISEGPQEKFDERRVTLLKSQCIQLERQVVLLFSALNSRKDMMIEMEGQLIRVQDQLGFLQHAADPSMLDSLTDLQQTVEGMRCFLHKTAEATNPDMLELPALMIDKFLKRRQQFDSELTLLDICSGKLDHLNLKHVSKLESKLCKTYKQMLLLKEVLSNSTSQQITRIAQQTEHLGLPIRERLANHVTTTTHMLGEACQDLLSLSVLFPAAPWPPLKKKIRSDFTLENIMAHMPQGLSRKREQEVVLLFSALNSRKDMMIEMEGQLIRVQDQLGFLQHAADPSMSDSLTDLQQTVEGMRCFLHKTAEATNPDMLELPALMIDKFLKRRQQFDSELTLLDICSGKLDHLNLKHVIHSVVDALLKAVSYNRHMLAIEVKVLKEELAFHQQVYDLQVDYSDSLLDAVRSAYRQFEQSTLEMLCQPLDGILDSYEHLKSTTSEEALRDFLTAFKDNSDKLSDAIECLKAHGSQEQGSDDALSQFGNHFLASLCKLTKQCTKRRDELMAELLEAQEVEQESSSAAVTTLDGTCNEQSRTSTSLNDQTT
ncbi:predicted protein [Nematostella vectensis]|uniref:Uncharacterized protein n=1 Tax=Nematostella vectensis TaxID=45351 RepID=A7RSF2_NEMVE|nr:predicted protein [Nematostella vectensis]|eukprot:XP_001637689.1 predicted protein [Nematostella vectensis]